MAPTQIYTRKTMGLDNRVWRLMLTTIILSAGLLSYRLLDKEECTSFSIAFKPLGLHTSEVFYTGETISFIASIPSKEISWNFDDNTGSMGPTVYHQFLKEGIFHITAGSNSLCKAERDIVIKNRPAVVKPSQNIEGSIAGPVSCHPFEEQIFTFTGPADSYEWSVPNNQSLANKSGQTIKYVFTYAGKYTVQVELDHDRSKRYYFDVIVEEPVKKKLPVENGGIPANPLTRLVIEDKRTDPFPAPPPVKDTVSVLPEAPASAKFLKLTDASFTDKLKKVIAGEMSVQDFDKYLCGGAQTPVVVNGRRQGKDFKWLCEDLQKRRGIPGLRRPAKLKLAALHYIQKDCVDFIEVEYK